MTDTELVHFDQLLAEMNDDELFPCLRWVMARGPAWADHRAALMEVAHKVKYDTYSRLVALPFLGW